MQEKCYDAVVIGSGASGMGAILYLKRAGLSCCILEDNVVGGQLVTSAIVSNYPGIKEITGPDLAINMYKQLKELDVEYIVGHVEEIKLEQELKLIVTKDKTITSHNVIIASGRVPRKLNVLNEDKLIGRGISYCVTCDGPLYKDKKVVVVGAGDSALEAVSYLASICKEVIVINKYDIFKGQEYLQDRMNFLDNVKILYNTNILEFGIKNDLLDTIKTDKEDFNVDGCFIFIGYTPASSPFKSLGIVNDNGYITTNNNMETSVKGIYAVGDIRDKEFFQIVTALSDGATAAMSIAKKM